MKYFSIIVIAITMLIASCKGPAKPKAIIHVQNSNEAAVSGVQVFLEYPMDSIENVDYIPGSEQDNPSADSLIGVDSSLLKSGTTNVLGNWEVEFDKPAIIRATATTDTSIGSTMVNFVEDQTTEATITLTP